LLHPQCFFSILKRNLRFKTIAHIADSP
jgi:hypothetical protein